MGKNKDDLLSMSRNEGIYNLNGKELVADCGSTEKNLNTKMINNTKEFLLNLKG